MPVENLITTKPAHNRLNLVGVIFGLLTVQAIAGRDPHSRSLYWECLCICGNITYVRTGSLRSGMTRSCGCQEGAPTHRLSHTRGYHVWWDMNRRCFNSEDIGYKHYGARGITVCLRWRSVENFIKDVGQPPDGLTLDRKDNNGNYSCGKCSECMENNWPLNVHWTTYTAQNRNKRGNRHITAYGKTMLLVEWVLETGIPKSTILNRLNRGWTEEEAITKPINTAHQRK